MIFDYTVYITSAGYFLKCMNATECAEMSYFMTVKECVKMTFLNVTKCIQAAMYDCERICKSDRIRTSDLMYDYDIKCKC